MDSASNNVHNPQQPPDQSNDSWGNSADNDATDNEQEDLPYDGILEHYLVPNSHLDLENISGFHSDSPRTMTSLEEDHPNSHHSLENITGFHSDSPQTMTCFKENLPVRTVESGANDSKSSSLDSAEVGLSNTISKSNKTMKSSKHENDKVLSIPTIIPDVLLRHFNKESLLHPHEFIDFETMPEISIEESIDEMVISRKSCSKHSQFDINYDGEDVLGNESSEIDQNKNTDNDALANESSEIDQNKNTDNQTDILKVAEYSDENQEGINEEFQEDSELCVLPPVKDVKPSKQDQERRLSSSDIKYGQGQVHYKLPDFSKVPPKVKIPKCDVSNVKPNSTHKRVTPSSSLMGRSFVIQDILESMQPSTEHEQVEDSSFWANYLQTQVPETSVYTSDCKLQINSIVSPASALQQQISGTNNGIQAEAFLQNLRSVPASKQPQNTQKVEVPTEGEKMSRMLMDQAQQLKSQVESFSDCLSGGSLSRKEELMAFHNLKSCLESLELNYLSTKEKHRDLQLQAYRNRSLLVGEFDKEREVEGQIYRLDMLLDDIQEQINKREESLAESLPLMKPHEASALLNAEESVEATSITKQSVTEEVVTRQEEKSARLLPYSQSLNSTNSPDVQDPPLMKNGTENPHATYPPSLSPSPIMNLSGTSNVEFAYNSVLSLGHLAGRDTYVAPVEHDPPEQKPFSSNLFEQSHIAQIQRTTDVHCHEFNKDAGCVHEKTFHADVDPDQLFLNSYPNTQHRKTNHITSGNMSLVIQDKALNFEIPDCIEKKDYFKSDWMVSSHSQISHYRHQILKNDYTYLSKASSNSSCDKYRKPVRRSSRCQNKLLNPKTPLQGGDFQKLKLNGPSSAAVYLKNKKDFSDQTDLRKCSVARQYMPLTRYCVQASVSCPSKSAAPRTSTLLRNSWPGARKHSPDCKDSKILNFVLDQALRTAKSMQKTSEKMLQQLTALPGHSTLHQRSCHW